ncbi:MAG: pseudouridine synthase [Anaerolineales bacterium]|jgi:23S rRNA pseudouridine2605 synthase
MAEERVQKILARAGIASRRASEKLIREGRVTVNGKIIHVGDKAVANRDKIEVDGKLIQLPEVFTYIALYKPRNVLSTTKNKQNIKTILDLLPNMERVFPVGRLDFDSEGLILLTNDGELTNHLTHPRYGHEKEYRVLVAQHPDEAQLTIWRNGVVLEDGYRTAPAKVYVEGLKGKGAWLRVVMKEGKKRQIREIAKQIGLPVVKLVRIRIDTLYLGNLKPGEWRYLSEYEIQSLKNEKRIIETRNKKKQSKK